MKAEHLRRKSTWLILSVIAVALISYLWGPHQSPPPSPRDLGNAVPAEALSPPSSANAGTAAAAPLLLPGASGGKVPAAPPAQRGNIGAPPTGAVDRYASATVLSQKETRAADGKITRSRLIKTAYKYPVLRVEDTIAPSQAGGGERLVKQRSMVGDHVMVKAIAGVPAADFEKMLASHGATVRRRIPRTDLYLVQFPAPELDTVPNAVRALSAEAALIQYAEPDYLAHLDAAPNDPRFPDLWNMHNTGQAGGAADADIDAPEAWDICTGSQSVLVAVIDTGIDYRHPDLAPNIWTNPREIPGNGIDDDDNGYIDDVHGWDVGNDDNDPNDEYFHGTHCAGIIGAAGNNTAGGAGVCWQVSLVPINFFAVTPDGVFGTYSDAVEAVNYATGLGVTLSSNSWGGSEYSEALKDAVDAADAAGILFVAAAGNEASNNDAVPVYPANLTSGNVISVAATDRHDGVAYFSNYGASLVHLGAPGLEIVSAFLGGGGQAVSGTSMAAPHVAGACALVKAYRSELNASAIKRIVLSSVDQTPAMIGRAISGGRLNIHQALLTARDIAITTTSGRTANGPIGGPFDPAARTYTLTNFGSSPAMWTAVHTQPWMDLSKTGGTLVAGGSAVVTVTINIQAAAFPEGKYEDTLTFTNTTTGQVRKRTFSLWVGKVDYFTEGFDFIAPDPSRMQPGSGSKPFDLAHLSFTFFPDDSLSGYQVFREPATTFPTNPAGGTVIPYRSFLYAGVPVTLGGGKEIALYGVRYPTFYIDDDGFIKFRAEAGSDNHFGQPRISSFYSDFAYFNGGSISWKQLPDRVAVTFENVVGRIPYPGRSSFQTEMFFDGRIRLTYLDVASTYGAVGLSRGEGTPLYFVESDFSTYPLYRELTLTVPASAVEGNGALAGAGIVSVGQPPSTNVTVKLTSLNPAEVTVPASVIIPAGQLSARFDLIIVDDSRFDGTQAVTVRASELSYAPSTATIAVHDNESGLLSLILPASVSEAAGTVQGTITLNSTATSSVTVNLASSDPTALLVPASVIIPSGQSSASFSVQVVDDNRIDGAQHATLTVSVTNWPTATASIDVLDDESRNLTVTLPAQTSEGSGPVSGSVYLSGSLSANLVVTLSANDPTEVSVPATVTIPAGQTSASFSLTIVDDADADGVQTAQVTASAPGFGSATGAIQVADNDAHHFTLAPIAGFQIRNAPFIVRVTARDVNDAVIFNYNGQLSLTCLDASQTNQPLSPTIAAEFVNGEWSGAVSVGAFGTGLVLVVNDGGSHVGMSNSFNVGTGLLDHFAWSSIPSPQSVDIPIPVTLTAQDAGNNVVPTFNATAYFSGLLTTGALAPIAPTESGAFSQGVWSGLVSVPFVMTGGKLHATDGEGRVGTSNSFDVTSRGIAQLPFNEDFENGAPGFGWTFSGTNRYRIQATTAHGPHTGSYHLTLDAVGLGLSRNEATLTVDLADVTNGVLTFWAKEFNDAPHGPPASPFIGGADFDGVAISADGMTWYEVQPLRSLTGAYSQLTVDLDAAILARGLSYNSEFKIRFNQYGISSITGSGIAIDDIAITGGRVHALTVRVPVETSEGAGGLTGSVTLPGLQAAEIIIALASSAPGKVRVPPSVTVPAGRMSADFALEILDDAAIDGPKTAVIRATAAGFSTGSGAIRVSDDEAGTLSLAFPAVAGQTTRTVAGSISLSTPPSASFRVTLSSSDPLKATVPAFFIIQPGQTSIPFNITIGDAAAIDGLELVTISATVPQWGTVSRTINLTDGPTPKLTLAGPAFVTEGDAFATASVSMPTVLANPVVVSLQSSHPGVINTPATVTIPAGALSASFPLTVVDDTLSNASRNLTITASASGLAAVTFSVQSRDNEFVRYEFEEVNDDAIRGVPFEIAIKALTANGLTINNYAGTLTLSAAGKLGPVPVSPATLSGFANGIWRGEVTLFTFDDNIRFTVVDEAGHSATSDPFGLTHGPVDHYRFSPIPSPQRKGAPFHVTITALDSVENVVQSQYHPANLRAVLPSEPVTIGTGLEVWTYPVSSAQTSRAQAIYLASELGGARRIASLALDASVLSGWRLSDWTIRIKATTRSNYAGGAAWEGTGWTTVFRSFQVIDSDGWLTFPFTTPFDYDGVSNLLIDFSYHGSRGVAGGGFRSSTVAEDRALVFSTDSELGDPRDWSGGTNPIPEPSKRVPNLKLDSSREVTVIPTQIPQASGSTQPFEDGIWSGSFTLFDLAAGIQLTITDSSGRTAVSNLFDVTLGAPTLNAEPAFTRGTTNTVSWQSLAGATTYEIQRATDGSFAAPESSGWIADTDHTFSGLPNGVLQFYRARARFGPTETGWSQVGFSTQDAVAPLLTLALTPGMTYTTLPAITLRGTAFDASGLQGVTADGRLAHTSNAFAHWSASLPNLRIGQNSLLVIAADQAAPPNTATLLRTITRQADSDGDRLPDDWETQHGLDPHNHGAAHGLLGDANGNGIVNMLEYELAPDAVISNGLLQASRQTNPADGHDYLVVTYRRRAGLLDFQCLIETSEDLVAWSAAGGDVQEILPTTPSGDGLTETVTVRIQPALSIGGVQRKAARLRISAQ